MSIDTFLEDRAREIELVSNILNGQELTDQQIEELEAKKFLIEYFLKTNTSFVGETDAANNAARAFADSQYEFYKKNSDAMQSGLKEQLEKHLRERGKLDESVIDWWKKQLLALGNALFGTQPLPDSQVDDCPPITEEEKIRAQSIRLAHQSYLLLNIEQLAKASKNDYESGKKITKQFARIEHERPFELNNLLFSVKPKYDILINSNTLDLSMLIPKIRIFKEYSKDNKKQSEKKLIEFPFEDYANEIDFTSMLTDRSGRGSGAGIKSFSWNTIGTNSASKYAFSAELNLFFQNIEDLDRVRRVDMIGDKKIETRFSDLIMTNTMYLKEGEDGTSVYNPDYFRIKIMVGWYAPKNISSDISKDFIDEINNNNLSLYTTLIDHAININEDSTVELKINFTSYVESMINYAKNSNILSTESDLKIQELQEQYEELGRNYSERSEGSDKTVATENLKTQQEKIKKQLDELRKSALNEKYTKFFLSLTQKNLLRSIPVDSDSFQHVFNMLKYKRDKISDREQIKQLNETIRKMRAALAKSSNTPDVNNNASNPGEIPNRSSPKTTSRDTQYGEVYDFNKSYGENYVHYFYLGDLLETILENIFNGDDNSIKNWPDKSIKIMLGPLGMYDYGELVDSGDLSRGGVVSKPVGYSTTSSNIKYVGRPFSVNIADIPISFKLFGAWFNKNIIDKGLINMTFKEFIDSLISDMIIRVLSAETYGFAPRQRSKLIYKPFTLPNTSTNFIQNNNLYQYQAEDFRDKPLRDTSSEPREQEQIENYILIYGFGENAFILNSNYEEDKERGIRHLLYGTETGMIKKINFSKVDDPLTRKHNLRMAVEQGGAGSKYLRGVYNATVEMYGNCLFDIGQTCYIAPTFYGSSRLGDRVKFVKDLGIGGYFNIIKINNTISADKFETKMDLMWQARGDGSSNINDVAVVIKK